MHLRDLRPAQLGLLHVDPAEGLAPRREERPEISELRERSGLRYLLLGVRRPNRACRLSRIAGPGPSSVLHDVFEHVDGAALLPDVEERAEPRTASAVIRHYPEGGPSGVRSPRGE